MAWFGRGQPAEVSNDKPNFDETLATMVTHLVGDSDLRTTEWVSFVIVAWLAEPYPIMQVFRYDERGEPYFVDFDHDVLAAGAEQLRQATPNERGEKWRAAVLGYVDRTSDMSGEFHYGADADPWLPDPVDGARSYELALAARPE